MSRYVSLPKVREDIKKAALRVLKRAGIDAAAVTITVAHPERAGGRHAVRIEVRAPDLAGAEEAN